MFELQVKTAAFGRHSFEEAKATHFPKDPLWEKVVGASGE